MAEVDLAAGELRADEPDLAAGELRAGEPDLATGELGTEELDLAAGELGPAEADDATGELRANLYAGPVRLLGQQQTPRVTVARALLLMAEYSGACAPGRGRRVAAAAERLGREIGMRSARLALLRDTGLLLDVGFVGLPLDVAQRSRPLTDDEEEQYQLHPMRGLELVRESGLGFEQLNGIMHHHERHDGLGYPMGLAGGEIPEFARILAIVDAYDDLTNPVAGSVVLSVDDAIRELRQLAGTHLDPTLVSAFSRAVNR